MNNNNPATRPNVLVVEDDRSITRMLRFSLKAAGFGITEVSTGAEAIGCMENDHPAAVVLDLALSGGDAATVLSRLRHDSDSLPAWVVISSLDRQEAAQEHGPFGDHFLGKPFDPWELIKIIKGMLTARSGTSGSETVI